MSVLGLGTDIVEISRVASVSESSERFAKRVLAESELDIYQQHTQPERYLAKRWAAKEAAAKALGTGIGRGISFHHFITTNNELGAPKLQLVDKALEVANTMGVTSVLLSISDEKHYATATVILS
ncbi:holo-[acyl-carrier-protein] synthase [Psychrosphaera saromensis]|uniref:Holo-[acyl-carrier-protein] synthase n=1 Tax=Psychrosphaera saromensis TaxID=716813 RepID=A0A2S7UUL4_9GAMM|nr:holo-ACP synthase [Psychrosphaera saromensis]PQJ53418.1 holo-ACP synthase [Psychrosphaera saromensis]GHB65736.1 holo-[acyl-carrier-protein] synthase [Psychrosphaera saromensis]GLQ14802.1 holo-[acyl-carrier-protein] synthase [Psychrosphaera saromensis]